LPSWTRCAKPYLLLIPAIFAGLVAPLQAQAPWDLRLIIDPYPSPYLSDWEANPTISTLTLSNPGARAESASLVYQVINQAGQLIASGRSDPQLFSPGSTVITSFVDITGNSSHDQGVENQMRRTGRLPEGDYTACTVATDAGGFVLAEDCANFSILYPDPPYLVGPGDGEVVQSPNPTFQWTPSQVPPQYRLQYVFRLAEVLQDQAPLQALNANIPQFLSGDVPGTNLPYPISALPLEPGHHYAWRVQAIDQNGYPAASNNGLSEIGTFVYQPAGGLNPEGPIGGGTARIVFFDPATEHPELWAILDTASVNELMEYVEQKARSGMLEIPIPLPGVSGMLSRGDQANEPRKPLGGGPEPLALVAPSGCNALEGPFTFGGDRDKKAVVALIEPDLNGNLAALLACLGLPSYMKPENDQDLAVMFAIQGNKDGLPRITLAIRPKRGGMLLNALGLQLEFSAWVFNLLGDFTLDEADLPAQAAEFLEGNKIDLWGPGTEDFLKAGLKGVVKGWGDQSTKAGSSETLDELQKMLGVNFYGKIQFENSRLLDLAVRALCALPGEASCVTQRVVKIRGFVGDHGSTYRGGQLGTTSAGTYSRAGLTKNDKWALWASVPTTPPDWEPLKSLVTKRMLQLEIGQTDTSTIRAIPVNPVDSTEAPTKSRTRFILRDVLTGFDPWKPILGVAPDKDLSFYSSFSAEVTEAGVDSFTAVTRQRANADAESKDRKAVPVPDRAAPDTTIGTTPDTSSAWSRTQLSLAWGAKGTFNIAGGPFQLYDPTLRLRRTDTSAETLSDNLTVVLGGGWGFSSFDHAGTLAIEFGRRPKPRPDSAGVAPAQATPAKTATTSGLHFKVTARFSEDAAVDKLVSLLWELAVPGP
jgi:hypothetical protein